MPNTLLNQKEGNIAEDNITKDIKNLFTSERENSSNIDKIIRDIRTIFEIEDYYEPVRISNAFDDNFIEYESTGDEGKTLSIKECLNETKPYLSNMINDLQTQGQ